MVRIVLIGSAATDVRMRVLHLFPGRLSGGIDTMLVTLAREQDVCPQMRPSFAVCFEESSLARELRAVGAPVFSLGPVRARYPLQILRARARLRRLLAAERFDVVVNHSSWTHALFGGVQRRARLPLVFWMHNKAAPEGRNFVERRAGRLTPDLVVCNSHFTAGTMHLLFGPPVPPHCVIPCPVSRPAMSPDTHVQRTSVRSELGTSSDAVVIVQVGWPEPCKGHALHLAALSGLRELPGWVCWMVGGAETAEQKRTLQSLKALAVKYGIGDRVRFVGHRRDVGRLLAAADIFCQPNVDPEAFGIVFVEALYAGLPVVSARHGGVLEIVDDHCGRLTPPGDSEALASTLRTLVEDQTLRLRLAQAAPDRAAGLCSPDKILHETHERLAGLLASREQETNLAKSLV